MGPLRVALIIGIALLFVLAQVECQGKKVPTDEVGS